jgi:hypothetical protein
VESHEDLVVANAWDWGISELETGKVRVRDIHCPLLHGDYSACFSRWKLVVVAPAVQIEIVVLKPVICSEFILLVLCTVAV